MKILSKSYSIYYRNCLNKCEWSENYIQICINYLEINKTLKQIFK